MEAGAPRCHVFLLGGGSRFRGGCGVVSGARPVSGDGALDRFSSTRSHLPLRLKGKLDRTLGGVR